MAQCVAPLMRDHGGGSIVNIASMAAYSGGPGVCAYGASKAALVNLTKSMAQEWVSWNIRVNVLSPGPFLSEMVEGAERERAGFQGHDRRRNADEARRRPGRDRRTGALPRERRVVVRHRRRHLGVGWHAEVTKPRQCADLLSRWWCNYDEGNYAVLAELFTDDVHFSCRTDTGTTDYEEFVRADIAATP